MREKPSKGNTYLITLPLGPEGANDPTLMEGFPEHAKFIGYIIAEWSQVEYKIAGLVAIALGLPLQSVANMLYAIESPGARLDVMRAALSHIRAEPGLSEVTALFTEADSLRFQRNKFAHGLYGEGPNGEPVLFNVRKDSLGEVPLTDLQHQYARMKALSYRAGRLISTMNDTFQEQPPAPDASAAPPTTASDSSDPQTPPSPPAPQPPSPE